jgi:hypothetical protein
VKKTLILKIIAALFLLESALNYGMLLVLPKIDYFFWIQYVGAASIVAYFISAASAGYGAFLNKQWVFVSLYAFILFSSMLMSPVFPIPYSFASPGLSQAVFILSINLAVLALVICNHVISKRQGAY